MQVPPYPRVMPNLASCVICYQPWFSVITIFQWLFIGTQTPSCGLHYQISHINCQSRIFSQRWKDISCTKTRHDIFILMAVIYTLATLHICTWPGLHIIFDFQTGRTQFLTNYRTFYVEKQHALCITKFPNFQMSQFFQAWFQHK